MAGVNLPQNIGAKPYIFKTDFCGMLKCPDGDDYLNTSSISSGLKKLKKKNLHLDLMETILCIRIFFFT